MYLAYIFIRFSNHGDFNIVASLPLLCTPQMRWFFFNEHTQKVVCRTTIGNNIIIN